MHSSLHQWAFILFYYVAQGTSIWQSNVMQGDICWKKQGRSELAGYSVELAQGI
jgi:hypothetical protein